MGIARDKLEKTHEMEQAAPVMVQTPTKIRIPSSLSHPTTSLLKSTYCQSQTHTDHDRIRTSVYEHSDAQRQAIPTLATSSSSELYGIVPGGMVRDVRQEIVPNVVTRTAPPPPPQKRVCTLQANALEKHLKGSPLLGKNYGDSFRESVTKVVRKSCQSASVAKHRSVLSKYVASLARAFRNIAACCASVANVFCKCCEGVSNFRGVLRKCCESIAQV